MPKAAAEKILGRAAGKSVAAGDIVWPDPDLVTVHDYYVKNFAAALDSLGVSRVFDPDRVLISTDHEPVAVTQDGANRQKLVREIAERYGINRFYDAGRGGLGHVFPIEDGLVWPGQLVLGYDTHVTNFGAVGSLGIALVVEISEVMATGTVWVKVPETVRVDLRGQLSRGVSIRDVAQKLISILSADQVDYAVVEFGGPGLAGIGIEGRMTLCNTPCELGAKSALVEVDDLALEYLRARIERPIEPLNSDPDCRYSFRSEVDLSEIVPQVAVPPMPDLAHDVGELIGKRIHHAFIGSCASGMLQDLRDAATTLKGKKVHPSVRMYVTPASQRIAAAAAREGLLEIFVEAGAMITAPGCGVCAGGRIGPLADGEVSINTGTRNDFGRLGSEHAEIYLASPMTVAASAVAGAISDPRELVEDMT